MSKTKKRNALLITTAIIALGVSGTLLRANAESKAEAPAAAAAPQAMPVAMETIKSAPVRIWKSFSGRLEAVDFAEIRPQVSGVITEVRFEDGQNVAEGDILYVIDPRPFEAEVAQAQSELTAAKNRLDLAGKELKRAETLVKTSAISERIYDERANTESVSQAEVKAAAARLEQAKINLDYAYVKAPISGRVSRAEITKGNLVQAGPNAPILTSIVSDAGIYANFEVDEQTYLSFVRNVARDQAQESKVPVKMMVGDDKTVYEGFIHSFDNKIDTSSGTIRARALFDNADGALLPGMFASVEVGSSVSQDRILISERAIGTDQDRKFVYVVTPEDKTAYREVKLGDSVDGHRVVTDGLKAGDRIVSDGIIRVRPDMLVTAQVAADAAATQPAAGE